MSSVEESPFTPAERQFELINNTETTGPQGPFFNRDYGALLDLDKITTEDDTSSPESIIYTAIKYSFPPELVGDKSFQHLLKDHIEQAASYYRSVVHPNYPKYFADSDMVSLLYDLTDDFENCTLLHAVRSVAQLESVIGTEGEEAERITRHVLETDSKEAERIARLMILGEVAPEMLETPAFLRLESE